MYMFPLAIKKYFKFKPLNGIVPISNENWIKVSLNLFNLKHSQALEKLIKELFYLKEKIIELLKHRDINVVSSILNDGYVSWQQFTFVWSLKFYSVFLSNHVWSLQLPYRLSTVIIMLVTLVVVVMLVIMFWQICISYFRYSRLIISPQQW